MAGPLYCRIFSNIPGLCTPDANCTSLLVVTTRIVSGHCQMSARGHHPPLGNTALGECITIYDRLKEPHIAEFFIGNRIKSAGKIWGRKIQGHKPTNLVSSHLGSFSLGGFVLLFHNVYVSLQPTLTWKGLRDVFCNYSFLTRRCDASSDLMF